MYKQNLNRVQSEQSQKVSDLGQNDASQGETDEMQTESEQTVMKAQGLKTFELKNDANGYDSALIDWQRNYNTALIIKQSKILSQSQNSSGSALSPTKMHFQNEVIKD